MVQIQTNWFLFQRDLRLVPIVRVQCVFEKCDFLIFHILVTFLKTFLVFVSNWSYRLLINKACV